MIFFVSLSHNPSLKKRKFVILFIMCLYRGIYAFNVNIYFMLTLKERSAYIQVVCADVDIN